MQLIITMLNGTSVTLTVDPTDKVGHLKQLIQQKLRVPVDKQRLVFDNGQSTDLSDDSKTVAFYRLYDGCRLSLLVTEPPPRVCFQVFLRNEKGVVTSYDISPDETVDNFKQKVKCREGVEVSQQRLVFQSREMGVGKLSDFGVKEHSTIDLLLRLRGGL